MELTGWEWDDENLPHLSRGLSRRVVLQVTDNEPRFRRNKKGRAASHQMIGPDNGGMMWTICIVELAHRPGIWRVITGWPAEANERAWYRRSK